MPAKTFNDLQKRIDQWTQDMVNDDDKMKAWVDKHIKWNSLPSEKEVALDELFGVK
jgi:hypothetical protein